MNRIGVTGSMAMAGLMGLWAIAGKAQPTVIDSASVVRHDNGVLLQATPLHADGGQAIDRVAAEIISPATTWAFPALNDAGQNGDALADDGVWSLAAPADMPAGAYEAVFYVVDSAGAETTSTPVAFTFE